MSYLLIIAVLAIPIILSVAFKGDFKKAAISLTIFYGLIFLAFVIYFNFGSM